MENKRKIKMSDWNAIHGEIGDLYIREKISSGLKQKYYHYTTPEAVLGIFKDYIDNGCDGNIVSCSLRASHLRFLNDAQEYNDGIQWIQDRLGKKIDGSYDQVFSISFCGEGDLLSQWKWYGKHSGIAIEFDADKINYKYWSCKDSALPDTDIQTKPLLIKYTDDEKLKYYTDILDYNSENKLNRNSDNIISNLLVPFCKDKGFAEEKESRLVFYTFDSIEHGLDFKVKYFVSNGIIKPTLTVEFLSSNGIDNIVKSFIVGPGQNQNLVFNALVHIFDRSNFDFNDSKVEHHCKNGINILKSSIPFRG